MIRQIIHDPIILAGKSTEATREDTDIAVDLLETLIFHEKECIGMAANMIGIKKRIICFNNNGKYMTMFNPEITKSSGPYDTCEGCLSLLGEPKKVLRYKAITVKFQNNKFETKTQRFEGLPAQIIQHEIDHCNGILI